MLDFFNSRMDAQRGDGDWSVSEVLQVIIVNCRSWRGEGMKVYWKKVFWIFGLHVMIIIMKSITCMVYMKLILYFWQMFTQLRFTYEQESHPEEFFTPYVWQLVLSRWYNFFQLSTYSQYLLHLFTSLVVWNSFI